MSSIHNKVETPRAGVQSSPEGADKSRASGPSSTVRRKASAESLAESKAPLIEPEASPTLSRRKADPLAPAEAGLTGARTARSRSVSTDRTSSSRGTSTASTLRKASPSEVSKQTSAKGADAAAPANKLTKAEAVQPKSIFKRMFPTKKKLFTALAGIVAATAVIGTVAVFGFMCFAFPPAGIVGSMIFMGIMLNGMAAGGGYLLWNHFKGKYQKAKEEGKAIEEASNQSVNVHGVNDKSGDVKTKDDDASSVASSDATLAEKQAAHREAEEAKYAAKAEAKLAAEQAKQAEQEKHAEQEKLAKRFEGKSSRIIDVSDDGA